MYVMPTLDPLLTFSDLILTPTPISLAMFLPPRLPSFVTSDHAFDLVLISILLVLMITVSSEDFMYLALFIFVEYSTFVDISSLILLVLYMLVPKCALSQFANWDPSLRTEIHLSQFAHWAPVPKLGSQFAH